MQGKAGKEEPEQSPPREDVMERIRLPVLMLILCLLPCACALRGLLRRRKFRRAYRLIRTIPPVRDGIPA